MSCLGDCWDIGPPPDTILFMPPPPIPSFLQGGLPELLINNTSCVSPQLCEAYPPHHGNRVLGDGVGGEFVELPRKDVDPWSPTIGDTWLLVLVASAIGVLLLGALLAMFLLKCREMNMFGNNDCSMHNRPVKNVEPRDCTNMVTNINSNKLVHPSETVLYHGNGIHADNRMVWAALTPRGTQHFISESYPNDLVDYIEADDHYETIDQLNTQPPPIAAGHYSPYYQRKDYEYEDPTPLIEAYQLNDIEHQRFHPQHQQHLIHSEHQYATLGGNTDMRCASMRRMAAQHYRPQVSSPTRIEHPNLPPLNLYPHNTLSKKQSNGTLGYRNGDTMTLPKYGI
ncbi:uncharacterized protein [Atheta coriaria]|uniref:uncharacterized protein isoform X2 n=1 Tax=Dalotia coriaria TaxID=877792 RepID=UPI0031F3E679